MKLLFEAASVPLEASSPVITFNVTAEPYDMVHNPDEDMSDNRIILNSEKAIIADLQIFGLVCYTLYLKVLDALMYTIQKTQISNPPFRREK